jgi:hypothetical protein
MRARGAGVSALAAIMLVGCSAPSPVPDGIALPRHGWTGGGPAALGSGTLQVHDGCLVLRQDDGTSYLIVWPGAARLAIAQGVPAVTIGDRTARLGDEIHLGGGYYTDLAFVVEELRDSVLPPGCATPEIFMTTGFAEG